MAVETYVNSGYVNTGYIEENLVFSTSVPDPGVDSAGEIAIFRNGYYDKYKNAYLPNSQETWDDNGDSAGYTWEDVDSWDRTPVSPLVFVTNVVDTQKSHYQNPNVKVVASGPSNITVYYGDTLDSSGAIETPSSFSGGQNQTVNGAKARYWQFAVSVAQVGIETPFITSITSTMKGTVVTETITDLDTSTLSDSTGIGTLVPSKTFSAITNVVFQPQSTSADKPQIYVRSKSTSGIEFEVFDLDTYGKTRIDCVCDVRIEGLPVLRSDAQGNILEVLE